MSATPLHDWLLPRLRTLVADAVAAGFEEAIVVAVLTDLVETTTFAGPGGDADGSELPPDSRA